MLFRFSKYALSLLAIWLITYCIDSFFGGYILIPETIRVYDDKCTIRYIDVRVNWHPRLGRVDHAGGSFLGLLYYPLIEADRLCWHKSISLFKKDGFETIKRLPKSSIHPMCTKGGKGGHERRERGRSYLLTLRLSSGIFAPCPDKCDLSMKGRYTI